jgi:hypothetical protein
MTTEVFTPLLRRIFVICAQRGAYPPPPPQLADAQGMVPEPNMTYTSRMAMATRSLQNSAWNRTMENAVPAFNVNPEVADIFDFEQAITDMARNDGMPETWIRKPEDTKAIREARNAAAQQMQEAEVAQKGADALQKFSTVPKDLRNRAMNAA